MEHTEVNYQALLSGYCDILERIIVSHCLKNKLITSSKYNQQRQIQQSVYSYNLLYNIFTIK